ncbi:HAD family phosphatase [Frankia sp. AgB32]|uniref:HAD family hydrolase n=1 Tax=Frankia sp. AgB32 TaxID=631119 RepID=UPI00200DEBAD|nr:HAD family phosphatase [Frankia sp. AgB32]MCK9894082.1 HAD family phosphatase [Frankia sp. AgB32]
MGDVAAVVFDLDGVLVDSEQVWDEVRRAYVGERGGRWEADSTRRMMGMSTAEWSGYLASLGVAGTPDDIAADIQRAIAERYGASAPLLPGAADAVRALVSLAPLAVASSSPRTLIELVLAHAGLTDLFAEVVSSEEVARGKPAPDVYLEAARRLGVPATGCVAIEDSTNGLRSAAAAGMAVIAVPNHHFPPEEEALRLAHARITSTADLTPDLVRAAASHHQP